METVSAGSSSPSAANGLPQQPRAALENASAPASQRSQPLSSSPRSSSSSQDSSHDSSAVTDEANGPSDAADTADADDSLLRHPKGKRKRTAAKDKAILEAAYLANPKPDKTARLDIVRQVSLNEKEVQIWFQNRRQNDRRKSRPLSAQEIAALRLGGIHALSSDPSSPFGHHMTFGSSSVMSSSPPQQLQLHQHHQHQQQQPQHAFHSAAAIPNAPSTTPLSSPELGPWQPEALARKFAEEQQQRQQEQERDQPSAQGAQNATPPSLSRSFSSSAGSVGYLANRWNAPSAFASSFGSSTGIGNMGQDDGVADDAVKLQPPFNPVASISSMLSQPQQSQQSRRTHQTQRPSQRPFRISLSLEGKAEVIASMSPSPPRRLPLPQPTTAIPFGRRTGSSDNNNSNNSSMGGSRCSSSSSNSNGNSANGDSPMPSLPALQRSGLSRSQSAFCSLDSGFTLPPISSLTGSLDKSPSSVALAKQPHHPPRLLRGRSRDVHAWESVCDADTRVDDELSEQAQHEASGSAIAAISLLRSTSNTSSISGVLAPSSVLQPNGVKRNMAARSMGPRPGATKRAKLGRASSSISSFSSFGNSGNTMRMQSAPMSRADNGSKDRVWTDDEKKKKLKLSTILSGNDSDKENWSPDEEGRFVFSSSQQRATTTSTGTGNNSRRPLPTSRNGQKLGDSAALLGGKRPAAGGKLAGGKESDSFDVLDIYEDGSSDNDRAPLRRLPPLSRATTLPGTDEVEKFMRGGEVSPSKKGDLDCVAGLLSLSQGIWR